MSEIKVESGVQMPDSGRKAIYPWNSMEVGDSFAWPAENSHHYRQCYAAGKSLGRKFASRKMPNGERRIWRVA